MDKYKNKYRIASARAAFWDYSWNAAYFVTTCTKSRECWFGEISDGEMKLSTIGHIANSCWHEIPKHFPFVMLGAHIVMPNHVHGIIIINKPEVETQNFASLHHINQPNNQFGPQSQNLASVIRGFKVGVTLNARQMHSDFSWQSRYHDHIIRNKDAYQTISEYIIGNPLTWKDDKFYNDKKK